MAKEKANFTVQILGGRDAASRSSIIYTGASEQFARHDANTARTAAVLGEGKLSIVLRKDGIVIERLWIAEGQCVAEGAGL